MTFNDSDFSPDIDRTKAFLRYVAAIASKVTAGETDPTQLNWSYIRDQAFLAIKRDSHS